jgi:hypothetical protein
MRSASWDGHDRRDEVGQQETSSSDRDQINCPAVAHYVEISGVLLVSICPKAHSGRPKHLRVIQAGRREAVPVDREYPRVALFLPRPPTPTFVHGASKASTAVSSTMAPTQESKVSD